MTIGVNEPGFSDCKELWCDYDFWGGCKHSYWDRVLNGYFKEYIIIFMALVPVLGLLAVVLNLVVSRFYSERQEAISSLYLVISYVNVLVGVVAFLYTGTYFTQTLPCNSQPPEIHVSKTWIQFQVVTNLLTLLTSRVMPLLVAMVTVIRAREVYLKKRDLNFRIPLLISLLWILGWAVGLGYTVQMRETAANIYLPMYAVIERSSLDWAYYFFIGLDYAPLVLVSMPTILCTGLVGVAAYISDKGWEDKEYRTNVGVFQVGMAYLVCATCQVIGFGDILQVYLSRTFKLSLGFMLTYILTSGSVLLFATGFPLLTIRWDRRLRLWLTTSKEHVYDSISHYSSQYSSKTDMSTVWNFTRSIRSRVGLSSEYQSERTDMSTVYNPASESTVSPTVIETLKTDRSTIILPSPTQTNFSLTTARTDHSTATGITSLFGSHGGATRASSVGARTDKSSWRELSVTPPPSPPPTLTIRTDNSSVYQALTEPKSSPTLSKYTDATSDVEDYRSTAVYRKKLDIIKTSRREMEQLRSEREKLLDEYKSNLELLAQSGVDDLSTIYYPGSSDVSSEISRFTDNTSTRSISSHIRAVDGSIRARIKPPKPDYRYEDSDATSGTGSLFTVKESTIRSEAETDVTSRAYSRITKPSSDRDTEEQYTDYSSIYDNISSIPEVEVPISSPSSTDEEEARTDVSTRISDITRLGGRRREEGSERDESTVFSVAGKTDVDSD